MDQDTTHFDELKARRDALRERLRAKCEKIVAAVEALPEPKTFLEAERAARAVMVADRMVERVFSEPKAVKDGMRFGAAQGGALHYGKRAENAPIVAFGDTSPLHSAVNSCAKGEDETDEDLDEDIYIEPETPLSKTYLKLEQIAAKISALDTELNGPKSTKHGP